MPPHANSDPFHSVAASSQQPAPPANGALLAGAAYAFAFALLLMFVFTTHRRVRTAFRRLSELEHSWDAHRARLDDDPPS